jgi:hypothetical protein
MRAELLTLSHVLIARGVALVVLGTAAVIWPEPLLVAALIGAALVSTLSGLYEITTGVCLRGMRGWLLVVGDGAAVLAFGPLTAGVAALYWPVALGTVIGWLLLYAWLSFAAAMVWRPVVPVKPLLAIALLHVTLAILVVVYAYGTVLSLLYFGAMYAAALGAFHLAVGWSLRARYLRRRAHPFAISPARDPSLGPQR